MKVFYLLVPCLVVAPLAHAGVRMQSGADAIFLAPLEKPDPAAQRLPAAEELASPTIAPVAPEAVVSALSATMPSVSPTVTVTPTAPQTTLSGLNAVAQQLCAKAMLTTMQMAMVSYQQKANPKMFKLALAATAAAAEVGDNRWPTLTAFDDTLRHISPEAPLAKELNETGTAAHNLCSANPLATAPTKGSRVPIARPE